MADVAFYLLIVTVNTIGFAFGYWAGKRSRH